MIISNDIKYIGVNDNDIDLFESQYNVPNGISYNSYAIFDEKTAILDTVDIRKFEQWNKILDDTFATTKPDYLIVHHLEPDHAGSIEKLLEKYPEITVVGNQKTFSMLPQFFEKELKNTLVVKEGDVLDLGNHKLTFVMAPMVHWPEVMVSYESSEKILFSADAFGKFGSLDCDEEWENEARRYFINIVGKYGNPVQTLLKKASGLDIKTICPLHGPALNDNLSYYINLYDTWSSYKAEIDGVFVAYSSIYSNTKTVALMIYDELKSKGINAEIADVARDDVANCVALAFKYSKMICAAPSYDGGVFPPMADFISHLKMKTYQNRKVGFVQNGSWAPCAAKTMKTAFETMKNIEFCENIVTIKSSYKESDKAQIDNLVNEIIK